MRVLFISDVYFPRVNGVSTSIKTFRDDLRACDVETRLIAPDYGCSTATRPLTRSFFASRTETQGLVLLEALVQGTPVVSTAAMGTRSILTGDCGAVVVPEDTEEFAAATLYRSIRLERRRAVLVAPPSA